ncbi:MAG: U32 family peptidase [Deltaproteobacteria bacterium]|nr:U32 family peptidase [Deltaproteobacteria bacterium]
MTDDSRPLTILSPFDRPEEVEPLVRAGAHELYGGVRPEGWKGSILSANQRTFSSAQVSSEGAFAESVAEAARRGARTHLVLNAPLYDPSAYRVLMGLAERASKWGAAGVIVGDPGLLLRLREARLPLEVTLSTLAGAMNRAAFGFLGRWGITRAVLPRHLTLAEIGAIVECHCEILFEAFVLIGKCPNEEGYCTFQHVSPTQRWPCEVFYELSCVAGPPLSGAHPCSQWHASWREADRRLGCGLCALETLRRLGVRALKLVGRGGPTAGKVANVRLVAEVLRTRLSPDQCRRAYEERFDRPCHPLTCYFPELHPQGGAPEARANRQGSARSAGFNGIASRH